MGDADLAPDTVGVVGSIVLLTAAARLDLALGPGA